MQKSKKNINRKKSRNEVTKNGSEIYFYYISWSDYEYVERYILYSEKKISQQEFEALVRKLAANILVKQMRKKNKTIRTSDIVEDVVEKLPDYGFYIPQYEGSLRYSTNYIDDRLLDEKQVLRAEHRNIRQQALCGLETVKWAIDNDRVRGEREGDFIKSIWQNGWLTHHEKQQIDNKIKNKKREKNDCDNYTG